MVLFQIVHSDLKKKYNPSRHSALAVQKIVAPADGTGVQIKETNSPMDVPEDLLARLCEGIRYGYDTK